MHLQTTRRLRRPHVACFERWPSRALRVHPCLLRPPRQCPSAAAEGFITFDELRIKLEGLEETLETARRELQTLQDRRSRLVELEHDRDTLLETYTEMSSKGPDYLTPEDRHQSYKRLRLSVLARPGGDIEVSGVLGETSNLVKNNRTSPAIPRGKGVKGSSAPR
jgi:hypothetical protein